MTQQTTQPQAPPPVAAAPKAKPVKIKTLRPISGRIWDEKLGDYVEKIVEPNTIVAVHPDDAKMFVETKYKAFYSFGGERFKDRTRFDCVRAEYVK